MAKLILISLFLSFSAMGAEFKTEWTASFEKKVELLCSEDDFLCRETCEVDDQCRFNEPVCKNCIGSTVKMTYVFEEIGRAYRNSFIPVKSSEIVELLKSQKFVSLTSKSIYNHVDRFNSLSLRRQFRSLCENGARDPIALFHTNQAKEIGQAAFVICDDQAFELIHDPEVIFNSENLK